MANDTDDDKRLKLAEERDFTVADTQSLSRACIDAKANAYCMCPFSIVLRRA